MPSLSQSMGGLFVSNSHLARYSVGQGAEIIICAPRDGPMPTELSAWEPAKVCTFPRLGPATFGFARGLLAGLEQIAPDVVHAHGLWTFCLVAAFKWSKRNNKPFLVSIHGMLEPWALQQGSLKKRTARWLYQDKALQKAGALRATSEMEADNIRAAGFLNPIAVVPNGIVLPERPPVDLRPSSRPMRQALFLSRLHPKKGLINLISAWARVRPAGWELTIIGPDEGGHAQELAAAISAAGLEESIRIPGPVWGAERFRHFWEADLFVFPSYSENFGMVVGEALACELPVITTKGLPWSDLEKHQCGWWIDIGPDPLADALKTATAMSDLERREMGIRGRRLISENYTWDSSARKMIDVYRWLMGNAGQPECVRGEGA